MRPITNCGNDRVIDHIKSSIGYTTRIDLATSELSVFAYGELGSPLEKSKAVRLVLAKPTAVDGPGLTLLGGAAERTFRNRLESVWLARRLESWIKRSVELRFLPGQLPQSTFVLRDSCAMCRRAFLSDRKANVYRTIPETE